MMNISKNWGSHRYDRYINCYLYVLQRIASLATGIQFRTVQQIYEEVRGSDRTMNLFDSDTEYDLPAVDDVGLWNRFRNIYERVVLSIFFWL